MPGKLQGDTVLVEDQKEASQIHNKGYYGTPQSGGSLKLELLEVLFLVESGRLEVLNGKKPMDFQALVRHATTRDPGFEVRYTVYRDLRARGYVVKGGIEPMDFRVLPRGGKPSKDPSKYWAAALSEMDAFDLDVLDAWMQRVGGLRKEMLLGIVDEEGDLTYYIGKQWTPKNKRGKAPKKRVEALLLEDRTVVFDEAGIERLVDEGFYGKKVGPELQLSLIETAYLVKRKKLELKNGRTGRVISLSTLLKRGREAQDDFMLRLKVYENLREHGLIVKTGFKYGVHFRVYDGHPDEVHARYLVHAVPAGYTTSWPEVSRAIRLAHGVRKEMVLGAAGKRGVEYYKLERVRP